MNSPLKNLKRISLFLFCLLSFNAYSVGCLGDCKNGYGTFTSADGDKYMGDYVNGKWHGKGTFTAANGDKHTGDWVNGRKHGKGTFTVANGDKYTGEWVNGVVREEGLVITPISISPRLKGSGFNGL